MNHSCKPNASTIYEETAAQVTILFVQKDIQSDEFISICLWLIIVFLIKWWACILFYLRPLVFTIIIKFTVYRISFTIDDPIILFLIK